MSAESCGDILPQSAADAASPFEAVPPGSTALAPSHVRAGVIEVIEGYSTDVTLPEKVDLLVAEIVGDIASEEGLVAGIRLHS